MSQDCNSFRPPSEITWPGSKWWKVDFHAHSPASYDYNAEEGRIAADSDKPSFREWLITYMQNGIDAIVITDHNNHKGIDEARKRLRQLEKEEVPEYRPLSIFSGVEITASSGYHLLGIFDVDTPSRLIDELIVKIGYPTDKRNSGTATSDKSVVEISKIIEDFGGLPIPAHADQPKGVFDPKINTGGIVVPQTERITTPNGTLVQALKDSGVIHAIEVLTTEGAAIAAKNGWVPILGSDAHHLRPPTDSRRIENPKFPGSHFTWVKMEKPNLAGIKLAIGDGRASVIQSLSVPDLNKAINNENEILYDKNLIRHPFITGVEIKKYHEDILYEFGPWLNALIGGRGSGKSTIIELLRLTMQRYSELPENLQNGGYFSPDIPGSGSMRFWDDSTSIIVNWMERGRHFRVLWGANDPNTSQVLELKDSSWSSSHRSPDVFKIQIMSQKQVFALAGDPKSLLRILDKNGEFATWQEEFNTLCLRYRTLKAEAYELRLTIANEEQIKSRLEDCRVVISRWNSKDAKELETLKNQKSVSDRRELFLAKITDEISNINSRFDDLVSENSSFLEPPTWAPEEQRVQDVIEIQGLIKNILDKLQFSINLWTNSSTPSPRDERIKSLTASFPTPSSSENNIDQTLSEHTKLEERLQEVANAKDKLEQREFALTELKTKIEDKRKALTKLRSEMATSLSNETIRLRIVEFGYQDDIESHLRTLFQRNSGLDGVFDSFAGYISSEKNPQERMRKISELKSYFVELLTRGSNTSPPSGITLNKAFLNHLDKINKDEVATDVELWFPDDLLQVSYQRDDSKDFIPISQGSPGERTSALLALIMELGDAPLLLDQPEDDLENRLIFDLVVKYLRRRKTSRQIIVATHNANIVVNADAEYVVALKHGIIPVVEERGSIQENGVRTAIRDILEGGERALRARYSRLIDNSHHDSE